MGDLLAATADLMAVPSVSGDEGPLADRVERALRACAWLEVTRLGDNVVARTALGRAQRLVLAGHLDTVPPDGNATPRVEGDTVWGVGASDMKGGLAVLLDLATSVEDPAVDLTWCFYACEEVDRARSGLLEVWHRRPELLAGDAAVLGEPTDALVEAGCQGTMRVRITLRGTRAHTARPFTGRNAVHRLAPILERVVGWEGRSVILDGCTYPEQLQVVGIEGGVAPNVVPDEARVTLNHRYAPDRRRAEAEAFLHGLLDPFLEPRSGDTWEVLDAGDGAPPSLDQPLLRALVERSGHPPRAKVGWTDVASFWEHGVPAANFGPGDPLLAHHPDERVTASQLAEARQTLRAVIAQA
ncbi:MAG TPA: succinyl-diaminopimelate desuccinylase [Acidimicrobiales bacterium]|nr:succinyl-diaminopimelate desuccinylase [Acidimicrobiales bacterium]